MNSSTKFRMHMGCGEPLRSRWWVAQPVHSLSVQSKEMPSERLRNSRAVRRQGGKCKS